MPVPTPPEVTEPFAISGTRDLIPVPASGTPGRASFTEGFPPVTMQPVLAGGIPPFGEDMNGILYMLSSHTAYLQAGQPYLYSASVAADIGGYAVGTILGAADGSGLWINQVAGNMIDPDAGGGSTSWLPLFSYGYTTVSGLTGSTVTLTPLQTRKSVIILNGALIANLTVILPNTLQNWLIVNRCTGAFSVTVRTAAGTGVLVGAGGFAAPVGVYGDGNNIYPNVAPTVIPGDVAATPNTYAIRDGGGDLLARLFNTGYAPANFPMTALFAMMGTDGFMRPIPMANAQAQMLLQAFGGAVLAAQVPQTAVLQYIALILANAVLTGTPTAPTPGVADSSLRIANTQFANPGNSHTTNGFHKLPGGLIVQWGFINVAAGGPDDIAIAFPIAFPTACVFATANSQRTVAGSNGTGFTANYTAAGFTATIDATFAGGPHVGHWLALGF